MLKSKIFALLIVSLFSTSLYATVNTSTDLAGNETSVNGVGDSVNSGNMGANEGFQPGEMEKTKLAAPLANLLQSTQFELFIKEFELTLSLGICCNDDLLDCAVGVKSKMIEPIGYVEQTQEPYYFPFADITLDWDGMSMLKGDSFMATEEDDSSPRSHAGDAHFLYVPIMGIIFKKKLSFVCFHEGDVAFPYMSEFDPTWKKDYYYIKMIPHMLAMFTPQALLGTVFDCVATEVKNSILGLQGGYRAYVRDQNESSTETGSSSEADMVGQSTESSSDITLKTLDGLNLVINTFYFVNGCNGFTPVGGYANGLDPIKDLQLRWYGIQGLLHSANAVSPKPFLYKQTNAKFSTAGTTGDDLKKTKASAVDTMCSWKEFPLPIDTQYLPQLAYPTVDSAHENGSTGVTVSTAANVPGAKNSAVFLIWARRDYYAFAYFCGGAKKGH